MAVNEKPCSRILDRRPQYRSVEGRPIEVFSFGKASRTILLMAGVHGDEANGVEMVRGILGLLQNIDPAILANRVVVMPLVNPDGYEESARRNARNIDINRNFPTKDFDGGEDRPGGVEPASEPETKAILDVVSYFDPYLIISMHEALACVNYNGTTAVGIAERMSDICGLPAVGDIGYPCPGSMGTYYGFERELPVITLELRHEADDRESIGRAVLDVLGLSRCD